MGKNSYFYEKQRIARLKEKERVKKLINKNYFTNKKQINNEEVKNG
jgi:hypothetical protein|tara:strand:- start:6582 stop:6719 length:138 start_codon:yes stop_codon:yes gene_type:complete